jgi:cytochrome c oxidase subunit II
MTILEALLSQRDTVSSIFAPVSTPAVRGNRLATLALVLSAVVFFAVAGLIVYSAFRYRARPADADREPPQVYGSAQVEAAWTVIPLVLVVILLLATARVITDVQAAPAPPTALTVTVIGHQWWWEIRYPTLGIVTANELHIPVTDSSEKRPTFVTLQSADVDHSFWIPRLAGKTDLIPGRTNRMWVEPFQTGTFLGQCAEYCGTEHALMLLRVVVDSPEAFQRWTAAQRQPATSDLATLDSTASAGRRVFLGTACISCHAVNGTVATGRYGPDLTHLMSRSTIAAGAAPNTRERLRAWVKDPDGVKPGALMPAMQLDDARLDQLVAYLTTLQ